MLTARPKVAELSFQLYGRTLHPELFQVHSSREVARGGYKAKIDITSAGHVITWSYAGLTLTEVCCSSQQPVPEKRRLFRYRIVGNRQDEVTCNGGVKYQVSFNLETVEPELFWTVQKELSKGSASKGLVHAFESSGRMALGAYSYINSEMRDRKLLIQAFHTFPDDYAIVKSQSLFILP